MSYLFRMGQAVRGFRLAPAALVMAALAAPACSGDDSDDDVTGDASSDAADSRADSARADAGDANRVDARDSAPSPRVDASQEGPGPVPEAAVDTGNDAAVDTGADVGVRDGNAIDAEAGLADGRADVTAADARPDVADARPLDAQVDATPDGPADAQADTTEAATPVGPPLAAFIQEVDRVWCERVNVCCGGQTDRASCRSFFDANFGALGAGKYLQAYAGNFAGAHFAYDPVQAQRCIDLVRALTCVSTSAAALRDAYSACLGAVQAQLTIGQPGCRTSAECISSYCAPSQDGGAATCVALGGAGAACDDPNFNGDRCNYLGIISSQSNMHCRPSGPVRPADPPHVCSAGFASGGTCLVNQDCASGLCGGGLCKDSAPVLEDWCSLFPGDGG